MKIGDRVKIIENLSSFSGVRVGDLGTISPNQDTPPEAGFDVLLDNQEGEAYYFFPSELEAVKTGWSDTKVDVNLEARVKKLEQAVNIARLAFQCYQLLHEQKQTASGRSKARTNESLVNVMDEALKGG